MRGQSYQFRIVPQFERYYSEDTNFGVYTFTTEDDIPEARICAGMDPFGAPTEKPVKTSILSGKMQRLYLGSVYEVTALLTYNEKYKSYQYNPSVVSAVAPKSEEQQRNFLMTILTELQANTLLAAYPNIVEDVINNKDNVDISLLKGIGETTWKKIREKIIDNYVVSDILTMLQPLGVTYTMIKKLLSEEPDPGLLKQKLLDNPYIMTKIHGLGFKTVDALALKINPDVRVSKKRTYAFLNYYLRQIGESKGHTWVSLSELEDAVRDNINECMDFYNEIITEQKDKEGSKFLHIVKDQVGLESYFRTEQNIFDILLSLDSYSREWKIDIESGIKKAEEKQNFQFSDEQKEIIKRATESNVVLISGKAGTGKTSIARALLNIYHDAGYTVSCCALSAKAAQRITEATGYPASTIHRLLKAQGMTFLHNHDTPLVSDVIFVDECSMINSSLYQSLVCAIREGARLIMCGDNRQLPPIGYGNVFSDLLDKKDVFNINQLKKVHRQAEKSGILTDANKIRDGIFPIKQPELKIVNGELQDMVYMFRDNREGMRDIAVRTYLKSVEQDGVDNVVIVVPRKKNCANSTFEINKLLQEKLLPNETQKITYGDREIRLGAKVIQRINNYEKNVFNGEIGYVTRIWEEAEGKSNRQKFEIKYNLNDSEKIIEYTKSEIDQIDLAYALTIHLSQGSGYKKVIVIIDNTHYALLDTCLLYTAITRSKEKCLLLAEPNAFKKCICTNNSVARQTWMPMFRNQRKEIVND